MARRGYWQEFGQPFDDAEDNCLEQIEQHDGLRGQEG
jgi:hypothetical protein